MNVCALTLASILLWVSVCPYTIVEGPVSTGEEVRNPYSGPPSPEEEPWVDMTVIKTHYDCRGYPMWKEVSRIKSRAGESKVVKTSRESFEGTSGSGTSEKSAFSPSRKSRLRVATLRVTAEETTTAAATATPRPRPRPRPTGGEWLEIGPDRVIDTPVVSCPEGYNDDDNGRCRPVFPEPYRK